MGNVDSMTYSASHVLSPKLIFFIFHFSLLSQYRIVYSTLFKSRLNAKKKIMRIS